MDADPIGVAALAASKAREKSDLLQELVAGPLSASTVRLAAVSRAIPSGRDFHFYNNFPEFRSTATAISDCSLSSIQAIPSSGNLWGSRPPPEFPENIEDSYDWIVNLNDEVLERFDVSMDEFKNIRENLEENCGELGPEDAEGGFQLVYGKKKRKDRGIRVGMEKDESFATAGAEIAAKGQKKVASGRSRVPFHIPTIPKPQVEYNIIVNNTNQPFDHVWLEKSADGSRPVHPLETMTIADFVDRSVDDANLGEPLSLECTPFTLVDDVKKLKELVAKLGAAREFAVDLEHNQYRSFLGLTCLIQISTRTEDFIIDTLKLRIHVGPYLRGLFKDSSKRKIMHGADRDILWLQRDFGIYLCNLFDTHQASRLLQLERNSLEYLLHHFCGVSAAKEYQNADWRLRPLPFEMTKYAREDTHYLLHIYDEMKSKLLSASTTENDYLMQVYERSHEICMQLYEKELLTDTSYLHIYGLVAADFNSKQLSIVAALFEWRDSIARAEDESTGYILPNKALLDIARQMPDSSQKLRRLVTSKHHFVEHHLMSVVHIIRKAISNSSAFEGVMEQLKERKVEAVKSDLLQMSADVRVEAAIPQQYCPDANCVYKTPANVDQPGGQVVSVKDEVFSEKEVPASPDGVNVRTTQLLKKPTSGFGALLGNNSRRKFNAFKPDSIVQGKNQMVVEQIKSSLALPFHSFYGPTTHHDPVCCTSFDNTRAREDIASENGTDNPLPSLTGRATASDNEDHEEVGGPELELFAEGPSMSISDLSSTFKQCFQSLNERNGIKPNVRPPPKPGSRFELKPFDYAAARMNMKFGDGAEGNDATSSGCSPGHKSTGKTAALGRSREEGATREFGQPRRRQTFPASGNRSGTYR